MSAVSAVSDVRRPCPVQPLESDDRGYAARFCLAVTYVAFYTLEVANELLKYCECAPVFSVSHNAFCCDQEALWRNVQLYTYRVLR